MALPATAEGFKCGELEGHERFVGGCGQFVSFEDSYRCADCTASFHRKCLRTHFSKSDETQKQIKKLEALVETAYARGRLDEVALQEGDYGLWNSRQDFLDYQKKEATKFLNARLKED